MEVVLIWGRRISACIQSRAKMEVTDLDQLVCKESTTIAVGKGE